VLGETQELDRAIERLRTVDLRTLRVDPFERELLADLQDAL
jgi:hypothetical protein